MSTATTTGNDRPLRAVWSSADGDSVRESIQAQKNRYGAFLTARGLILGHLKTAGSTLAEVFDRWHLGGMVRAAKGSLGWPFGGFALVRRGITTAGVRPGIAWLLCTTFGQKFVRKAAGAIGRVVGTVGTVTLKAAAWSLRLLGNWGRDKAMRLQAWEASSAAAVSRRLLTVQGVGGVLLDPSGLPLQTVKTLARGRVLNAAVSRFLPRPWSILARVLVNLSSVPGQLRREAMQLLLWAAPVGKAKVTEVEPDLDPTPPAAPAPAPAPAAPSVPAPSEPIRPVSPLFAAPVAVPDFGISDEEDVEEPRVLVAVGGRDSLDVPPPASAQQSLQRYPAQKRSTNPKRKRWPPAPPAQPGRSHPGIGLPHSPEGT